MGTVRSVQCHLTFELDLEALSEYLQGCKGLEHSAETLAIIWDQGELEDVLRHLEISEVLEIVGEGLYDYGGIKVGSGRY